MPQLTNAEFIKNWSFKYENNVTTDCSLSSIPLISRQHRCTKGFLQGAVPSLLNPPIPTFFVPTPPPSLDFNPNHSQPSLSRNTNHCTFPFISSPFSPDTTRSTSHCMHSVSIPHPLPHSPSISSPSSRLCRHVYRIDSN